MNAELPAYINFLFILTVLLTLVLFCYAAPFSRWVWIFAAGWLIFQAILTLKGFYLVTDTIPPRFALMMAPLLILVILLFVTKSGRQFLDAFNLRTLTYLHTIRIPVEITIFLLVAHQLMPEAMSFEGRNFDIFSGITAPFVAWLYFDKYAMNKKLLLAWNWLCLILVLNVVIYGVLSAPTVFQQLSLDQPNKAIQYFPFSWLTSFVVPVVILSHLIAIRRLWNTAQAKAG